MVDKFTKKIYDIAICSLVYIFAEIKDKGYNGFEVTEKGVKNVAIFDESSIENFNKVI